MSGSPIRTNLGEWANTPTVQDAVIAYMEQRGCALILREIYHPLGLPRSSVSRVLSRLHGRGIVERHKVPVQMHRPHRTTRNTVSEGGARQCYLYSFVD